MKPKLVIIGIDPGIRGGIGCLVDGQFGMVAPMPIQPKKSGRNEVDVDELYDTLVDFAERADQAYCLIEQVHAMPGQGVSSMFALGDCFGCVRAVAPIVCERCEFVHSSVWKKAMKLNKDKAYSLALARKRFPRAKMQLNLAKHEGLAESLLLAYYGASQFKW